MAYESSDNLSPRDNDNKSGRVKTKNDKKQHWKIPKTLDQ